MMVEIVEYDDRTSNEDAVHNIQRLATKDKLALLVARYGTGLDLATSPLIAKYGYPQIVPTAPTDKVAKMS